jgi:hydrogenase expression/formation protein HypD
VFSFKDKATAESIIKKITDFNINYKFMHVCGTHQDTLVKNGLDTLLQKCGIEIGQGPGCPVCVTTPNEIEEMILLAKNGKIVTSFGDMLNVPGRNKSLQSLRSEGFNVRTVYSIEDSVNIAVNNKEKEVVFMAVGFETTAPTTASTIITNPPDNFSILSCHRLIPPALKAILDLGEIKINGLIEPGHVSTIIGTKPYAFISKKYNIPQVIAGFEPLDLLMAALMLCRQILNNNITVENEYFRIVNENGNKIATKIMKEVFKDVDKRWRGFPVIKKSGLELKDKYEKFDARKKYYEDLIILENLDFDEPIGCKCGDILRGLLSPRECPLFRKICCPSNPIGPCMVSSEGSCNIEFRYLKT